MDCRDAKERLIADLGGELSKKEGESLLAHLQLCLECAAEKEALGQIWRQLGAIPEVDVPASLRRATLDLVEQEFHEEATAQPVGTRVKNWTRRPLTAVFAAIALALSSLWVLRGVTDLEKLNVEVIFLCSVLLTGILAETFFFATASLPARAGTWRMASRIALTAFGLAMVGTLLCPKMNLIDWWETLPPGEFLLGFGQGISHAGFGLLYAFVPFFLAVCFFGRKLKRDLLSHALSAGIVFFVLLVPAILLQALPLSALVFFSWTVGSALGVTIAALGGAGLFRLASSDLAARA